jgi:predicted GNAT family N-acyltransferase
MATDRPPIELLTETSASVLQEIGRLRTVVWRAEPDVNRSALPGDVWLDDLDKIAFHWVARDNRGKIVAAARMTIHDRLEDVPYSESFRHLRVDSPGPFASLNRLVVSPDARGQGLARGLDCARLAHAVRSSAACVLVVAVSRRMEALSHLGFERIGLAKQTGTLLRIDGSYELGVHRLGDLPDA